MNDTDLNEQQLVRRQKAEDLEIKELTLLVKHLKEPIRQLISSKITMVLIKTN